MPRGARWRLWAVAWRGAVLRRQVLRSPPSLTAPRSALAGQGRRRARRPGRPDRPGRQARHVGRGRRRGRDRWHARGALRPQPVQAGPRQILLPPLPGGAQRSHPHPAHGGGRGEGGRGGGRRRGGGGARAALSPTRHPPGLHHPGRRHPRGARGARLLRGDRHLGRRRGRVTRRGGQRLPERPPVSQAQRAKGHRRDQGAKGRGGGAATACFLLSSFFGG